MRNERFHRSDASWRTGADHTLTRALADGAITDGDAALIRAFIDETSANQSISPLRRYKLVQTMVGLRRFIGPFAEASIADVYSAVDSIKTGLSARGTPMKQNTQSDYIRVLKRFCIWLCEAEHASPGLKLDRVRKITPPRYQRVTKKAGDLLSPTEITAMLNACRTSRDRALVATLYEGGLRIGEIGSLTWGQIEFTKWHAVVTVQSKTEYMRAIPLIMATPYLAAYRADYPGEPTADAYVFVTRAGRPIFYTTAVDQLNAIAKRAGIEKHVHPHLFRHSRITNLLKEGYPESMVKLMLWGNIGTPMLETYAHLTNKDIVAEFRRRHGLEVPEDVRDARADPQQCPRCKGIAGPTYRYCRECGLSLTEEATATSATLQADVENDPRYKTALAAALAAVGLSPLQP